MPNKFFLDKDTCQGKNCHIFPFTMPRKTYQGKLASVNEALIGSPLISKDQPYLNTCFTDSKNNEKTMRIQVVLKASNKRHTISFPLLQFPFVDQANKKYYCSFYFCAKKYSCGSKYWRCFYKYRIQITVK